MSRWRRRLPLATGVFAVIVALAAGGCVGGATTAPTTPPPIPTDEPPASPAAVELTIYAAASLRDVLVEVVSMYEGATGASLTVSTGSSAALETQIEQGAPADVFLSADTANPQKLLDAGLVEGRLVTFASNVLVVIVPTENPAAIQSPADLATPGLKIIAAGDDVPITKYASLLLENLAGEPGYPADFAAAYAANVVSKEDDVRSVVSKIEIGEGDAAIVYATDATSSADVAAITIPEPANVLAHYGGVVIKASASAVAAAAFLEWLAGPDGHAILKDDGFLQSIP